MGMSLLTEGLIRIFLPLYNPSGRIAFYSNEEGLYLGEKNSVLRQWKNTGDFDVSVRINRFGFRDEKNLQSSTEKDWFVVGDSFSFGWGIEESDRYSNLLERMLHVRVFNICVPGDFETYEKLIHYAEKNGAIIKNLIIGVCMENDLHNYTPAKEPDTSITPISHSRKLAAIKQWLTSHCALYNAVGYIVHQNNLLRKVAVHLGFVIENFDGLNRNTFSPEILLSSSKKLAEIAKNYNTLIVIISSRGLWLSSTQETERKVHDTFIQKLKEFNLKVIDLQPFFEEGGNPLGYHFKNDGHWNQSGHLKAAQVIEKFIEEEQQ